MELPRRGERGPQTTGTAGEGTERPGWCVEVTCSSSVSLARGGRGAECGAAPAGGQAEGPCTLGPSGQAAAFRFTLSTRAPREAPKRRPRHCGPGHSVLRPHGPRTQVVPLSTSPVTVHTSHLRILLNVASDAAGLELLLRFCISDQLPGDVTGSDPRGSEHQQGQTLAKSV